MTNRDHTNFMLEIRPAFIYTLLNLDIFAVRKKIFLNLLRLTMKLYSIRKM